MDSETRSQTRTRGAGATTSGRASGGRVEGAQQAATRRRREEILAAASDRFAARGFHHASLADIAAEVGISAAGILHHFKTKEQLLTEVLRRRDATDIEQASLDHRPEGLDFLVHLVDTAARNATRPGITQLYAVLSAESVTDGHPAQAWFRSRYRGLRSMVADALRQARELGELRHDAEIEQTAVAVVAVLDGLQVQWLLDPDRVDMEAVARRSIDALVASLAPPR